ncbi:MAG: PAS domain S-box protein [Nitrospirae bacterium]|nr:PAS domain S-box protein [Nitrospirota bacterium]
MVTRAAETFRFIREFSTRKVQLSLLVFAPIFLALVTVAPTIIVYNWLVSFIPTRVDEIYSAPRVDQIVELLKMLRFLMLSGAVVALISIPLLAFYVVKPIRRMMENLRKVALGDLTVEAGMDRSDELGGLGASFDRMILSLNRYILESSRGGVFVVNSEGVVTTSNPAMEIILGMKAEDLVGHAIEEAFRPLGNYRELVKVIRGAIQSKTPHGEQEVIVARPDGRQVTLNLSTSLLRDQNGIQIGVMAAIKNLSEIRDFHEHLRRTEKLASLGTLAAGVAHEIRNPLGSIRGLAQLLRESLEGSSQKRYAEVIAQETDRLNRVVESLLSFARPSDSLRTDVDVNTLLRRALQLCEFERLKKNIRMVEDLAADLPPVSVDSDRLVQAFLNILLNACQAIEGEGEIRVTTLTPEPGRGNGEFVRVSIVNTNSHISPDQLEHIFDPFFTTKENGTGLGLSVTHHIIQENRGSLRAYSENRETGFVVELPASKS